ncbi:Hypothetical predicted protein [Paramuricea clavata]|uniref:Uncharacterized protein n=1 Tax=Paramuricea clavata TaxID=317549 RepID=A0A6S7H0Y7_PARCT|nr:Hypothetical predicted protein [Paramuricea clavata]
MFNSVYLKELEKHCHRFLWRGLELDRPPDVYVMERVNIGDTPAPAISTEAIYKTADRFKEDSPEAAELLKKSSYVDPIDSRPTVSCALKVTEEAENMLAKGGFSVKCWQLSGEESPRKTASECRRPPKSVARDPDKANCTRAGDEDLRSPRSCMSFHITGESILP